ncbi:virion core protein, T7 gp14 family, partial [Herbiconiux daphne]
MAAGSLAGAAMSAKDKAKQAGLAEDAQRKQKLEIIKQTNIQNQDTILQDKQNLIDTMSQMSSNNLQGIKNLGMV